MRDPWTLKELQEKIPILRHVVKSRLEEDERQGDVKPLPPMTQEEVMELLLGLLDIASERPLTTDECFLHGQLLQQYKQAILATALGKKGRYYVVSEEDLRKQIGRHFE